MMNTETVASHADQPAGRRRLLYAGVAGASLIAGAGLALWKWTPREAAPDSLAQFWALDFDTPDGSKLAMQSLRGKPLVINFWATWCPPCVEELPLLDHFFQQNSTNGWQVVGLAIDQPSAVRGFLKRTPISFPVGMAGLGGTELTKALGNMSGGLPFTVVVGAAGEVLARRIGRITPADLEQWARLR